MAVVFLMKSVAIVAPVAKKKKRTRSRAMIFFFIYPEPAFWPIKRKLVVPIIIFPDIYAGFP